ncbi:hypothetical protein TNCV_1989921 [Trichonephila clavipes]|nr:hypothetical protein TNCV_1989921 [Trichonephila clavipes]
MHVEICRAETSSRWCGVVVREGVPAQSSTSLDHGSKLMRSVAKSPRVAEHLPKSKQIYRWKEEDFRVVKIEAELILQANRLQLMKQDLEKAENAYLSSFTSKKSKTLPSATLQLMEIQMARMYY